jgi:hypothetical protein
MPPEALSKKKEEKEINNFVEGFSLQNQNAKASDFIKGL